MNPRFTIDGSAALENHLAQTGREVLAAVQTFIPPTELEALVLGGGYGRGQGGVLKTDSGDRPYNDLEFYVFVRGNALLGDRRHREDLRALGDKLSPPAGLHVEFKIHSVEKLQRSAVSMFTYDLVAGHKIIFGEESIFKNCPPHLAAEKIPLHEATRLLFNRASGLLLAKNILRQTHLAPDDTDFIARNLAKAQLALGDVLLAAFGQYHWDCLERRDRLPRLTIPNSPPWLRQVLEHHAAGVEFKLHPTREPAPTAELARRHAELTQLALQLWLWLESRRLNHTFLSIADYTASGIVKCPESAAWRNALLNLKTFGPQSWFAAGTFRYPRERLFQALGFLLWQDQALNEPAVARQLKNRLRARSPAWPELIRAYQEIWQYYG